MPASRVSLPVRVRRSNSGLAWFTLPAITLSPACLAIGVLSPVSNASSTLLRPSSTSPSQGMVSPGFTSTTSPTASWLTATSCCAGSCGQPGTAWAKAGISFTSFSVASPVLRRAMLSR